MQVNNYNQVNKFYNLNYYDRQKKMQKMILEQITLPPPYNIIFSYQLHWYVYNYPFGRKNKFASIAKLVRDRKHEKTKFISKLKEYYYKTRGSDNGGTRQDILYICFLFYLIEQLSHQIAEELFLIVSDLIFSKHRFENPFANFI